MPYQGNVSLAHWECKYGRSMEKPIHNTYLYHRIAGYYDRTESRDQACLGFLVYDKFLSNDTEGHHSHKLNERKHRS